MGSKVKKVVKSVVKPIKKIVSSPVGQLGLAVFAPQFSFLKGTGFINQALNRALVNAAATKLSGGDVDLKSALVAGGIGAAVPNIPGISGIETPALQRAAVGSLTNIGTNLATGRDVNLQQAALAGGLSAGVGALQDRFAPMTMEQALDEDVKLRAEQTGGAMQSAEQLSGIDEFAEGEFIPASGPRFSNQPSLDTFDEARLLTPTSDRDFNIIGTAQAAELTPKDRAAFRTARAEAVQAEGAGDLAEAEAARTVGQFLGRGDPVGPGGVPLAQPTVRASFSNVGKNIMSGNFGEAISELTSYVTDKQNAPKVLLGALTAAPLFFSPEQQEDETAAEFAQRRSDVTKFLRQYGSNFYSGAELDDFLSRTTSNLGYASGGRVGLAEGSGGFESAKDFIESTGDEELMDMYIDVLNGIKSEEALFKLLRKKGYQTYAVGGRVDYAEGSKDKSGIMMASAPDTMDSLNDLAQMLFGKNLDELTNDERDELDDYNRGLMAKGGMPTGIMRTNAAGIKERDYRETGGFVPVGIKEKADDVPAMLSKNEFVMTADAVRGAGNGSIEKGAQKMYDTMKELENRVA